MPGLVIATEDELSEAVALRLVAEVRPALQVTQKLRRNGFGYLRSKMANWCELARHQPIFLLTDLDQVACPVEMLQQWRGTLKPPADLLMRLAIREVEAWLLADHPAMRELLGVRGRLPTDPEQLPDPKAALLQLAAKCAAREVRADLVPAKGSMASQGVGYNARLTQWVQTCWQPGRAAERAPSLAKTCIRLRELAHRADPT